MHQLFSLPTVGSLAEDLGPIIVNASSWSRAEAQDLQRCNKDGEVSTLALMLFWTKTNSDHSKVHQELIELCNWAPIL